VAGWLHIEISVQHQEFNPDMVAHLSTNQVLLYYYTKLRSCSHRSHYVLPSC